MFVQLKLRDALGRFGSVIWFLKFCTLTNLACSCKLAGPERKPCALMCWKNSQNSHRGHVTEKTDSILGLQTEIAADNWCSGYLKNEAFGRKVERDKGFRNTNLTIPLRIWV